MTAAQGALFIEPDLVEHAFAGDGVDCTFCGEGVDCTFCGEGVCFYLHADRPTRVCLVHLGEPAPCRFCADHNAGDE